MKIFRNTKPKETVDNNCQFPKNPSHFSSDFTREKLFTVEDSRERLVKNALYSEFSSFYGKPNLREEDKFLVPKGMKSRIMKTQVAQIEKERSEMKRGETRRMKSEAKSMGRLLEDDKRSLSPLSFKGKEQLPKDFLLKLQNEDCHDQKKSKRRLRKNTSFFLGSSPHGTGSIGFKEAFKESNGSPVNLATDKHEENEPKGKNTRKSNKRHFPVSKSIEKFLETNEERPLGSDSKEKRKIGRNFQSFFQSQTKQNFRSPKNSEIPRLFFNQNGNELLGSFASEVARAASKDPKQTTPTFFKGTSPTQLLRKIKLLKSPKETSAISPEKPKTNWVPFAFKVPSHMKPKKPKFASFDLKLPFYRQKRKFQDISLSSQ